MCIEDGSPAGKHHEKREGEEKEGTKRRKEKREQVFKTNCKGYQDKQSRSIEEVQVEIKKGNKRKITVFVTSHNKTSHDKIIANDSSSGVTASEASVFSLFSFFHFHDLNRSHD